MMPCRRTKREISSFSLFQSALQFLNSFVPRWQWTWFFHSASLPTLSMLTPPADSTYSLCTGLLSSITQSTIVSAVTVFVSPKSSCRMPLGKKRQPIVRKWVWQGVQWEILWTRRKKTLFQCVALVHRKPYYRSESFRMLQSDSWRKRTLLRFKTVYVIAVVITVTVLFIWPVDVAVST